MQIREFEPSDLPVVVDFGLRAWEPVFESMKGAMDENVFYVFYPDWRTQQRAAIERLHRSGVHGLEGRSAKVTR